MALWQARDAALLICQLVVVTSRGAAALDSIASTSSFEDFGNFGGFRGFHQFHGWLSNVLDDNAGRQSRGFPAGQEVHSSYIGKTYSVHEPIVSEEQPKDSKHSSPAKQSVGSTQEQDDHTGAVYDGVYEPLKLLQKQSTTSKHSITEEGPTRNTHISGGVYEPVIRQHTKPSKYSTTPKQPENKKEKHANRLVKPIQMLRMPAIFPHTTKPTLNKVNKLNPIYQVGNKGGFQPILYLPQNQLEAAIFDTAKQQASARWNNNVIYVYPNPYQQTLAAIDPAFRRVVKLQEPIEHHKKYLSYKSTLTTQVI